MEHLDSEINSLLKSSMACNTWKTYNSAIESFDKFRQIYKLLDIQPVPVQNIVRYIAHLSHAKTSASTVATYVSGWSHIHKLNGFDDPTKSFFVSKILEDLKGNIPGPKINACRYRPLYLNSLLTHFRMFANLVMKLLLLCSPLLLVWHVPCGRICSRQKMRFGYACCKVEGRHPKRNNLNEELYIKIRRSNTDQVSNSTTLVIDKQPDMAVCSVKLMNQKQAFTFVRYMQN